ncbi:MAG: hypothetical protein KDA22_02685 [Phycisphaerales bacterium]|nr:hypothetical protein [Phycisphaerales bacterium]
MLAGLRRVCSVAITVLMVVMPSDRTQAQSTCEGGWRDSSFERGLVMIGSSATEVPATVYAIAHDPDGGGIAPVVGGFFNAGFGRKLLSVTRWNGAEWEPMGAGFDGSVRTLLVADLGNGPTLHAGGAWAGAVARWTGGDWKQLGGGLNGTVNALALWQGDTEPLLIAGGAFTEADGLPASRMAAWDGSAWMGLGAGPNGEVFALEVFDDGSGSRLFAGGSFLTVGAGDIASHVAAWNGTDWQAVGEGLPWKVRALTVFDDGSGPALFAGGSNAPGSGGGMAKWNGSGWTPIQAPDTEVFALRTATIDGETRLIVGSDRTTVAFFAPCVTFPGVHSFDGSSFKRLGDVEDAVRSIAVVPGPNGQEELLIGGSFRTTSNAKAEGVARWNGSGWSSLAPARPGFWAGWTVEDAQWVELDGEPTLVITGRFGEAGDVMGGPVMAWRDGTFIPIGDGLRGVGASIATSPEEPGVLYVAGSFEDNDGDPATVTGLVRWDGSSWQSIASIQGGPRCAMAAVWHDDGTGQKLYLGGWFDKVNGLPAKALARWTGEAWETFGPTISSGRVRDLVVFDPGSGAVLCAIGYVAPAGGGGGEVAAWTGNDWKSVVSAYDDGAAGTVFDDGSGPALYAIIANGALYRWGGARAELLSSANNHWLNAIHVHDFGEGPRVVVGGAQSSSMNAIQLWNGATLAPLPGIFAKTAGLFDGDVRCLASFPGGRLLAGGNFEYLIDVAGYRPAPYLAVFDPSGAPWIVSSPKDRTVWKGGSAEFAVALFESEPPEGTTFQWRRNGMPLSDGNGVLGATTPTLVIQGVSIRDHGAYDVVVANACGDDVSGTAWLTVTCFGDIDGNGSVDGVDLGLLLAAWGTNDAGADLDGSGSVDAADLAALIAAWGAC